MRARQLRDAAVAVVLLVAAGCGGSSSTTAGVSSSQPGATGSGTVAPVPTTLPCPTEAVVVTKPDRWAMVKDFFGHQDWEGIGTVLNPNPVDVLLLAESTFALTDVTLTTGKTFQSYTGNPKSVLPAGYGRDLLILAGRTIEVTYSMTLTRPTSIIATEVFAEAAPEFGLITVPGCIVLVSGAKPISAAPKGPRLCAGGFEDPRIKAAIGIPGPSDQPSCG